MSVWPNNRSSATARSVMSIVVLVTLTMATALPAFAQTKKRRTPVRRPAAKAVPVVTQPSVVHYSVESGEVIRVRMDRTISSATTRVGDQFTTTVVDPVYSRGVEVIPAGSAIIGRITTVDRASRRSKAGSIGVQFVSLRLPNGFVRSINGDLTEVTDEEIVADNEGEVSGMSAVKRNVVFIGGGAATGALIGAIAGGGKGAGIGAGIGAGLGVAGAFFSKGHEAEVKSGTEFGVVLNQRVSLPASTVRSYY